MKAVATLVCLCLVFLSSCSRQTKIAVSSGDKYASDVAMKILEDGGTVVDAFISASLILNMTEPGASGLGGGFLAIYYDAFKNQYFAIDAREEQGSGHYNHKKLKEEYSKENWHEAASMVGVPGQAAGLDLLYREFGTMSLDKLFDPAIQIAENGFIVSDYFVHSHKTFNQALKFKEGELLKNPEFAKTLTLLQKQGLMSFYNSEISEAIIQASDNWLSKKDLLRYRAVFRRPFSFSWKNSQGEKYNFYSIAFPSAGAAVIKKTLKEIDIQKYNISTEEKIKEYLRATKPALKWRAKNAADADFVTDDCRPDKSLKERGTSHISLYDSYGNMLSATMTIQKPFGIAKKLPGYGFYLNNELTDFSEDFLQCNSFAKKALQRTSAKYKTNFEDTAYLTYGNKRPRSSMTPMIIFGPDTETLVIGGTGGWTIFSSLLQASIDILENKEDPQVSIDKLRFYIDDQGQVLYDGDIQAIDFSLLEGVEFKKHFFPTAINLIHLKDNKIKAYVDKRKGGNAQALIK